MILRIPYGPLSLLRSCSHTTVVIILTITHCLSVVTADTDGGDQPITISNRSTADLPSLATNISGTNVPSNATAGLIIGHDRAEGMAIELTHWSYLLVFVLACFIFSVGKRCVFEGGHRQSLRCAYRSVVLCIMCIVERGASRAVASTTTMKSERKRKRRMESLEAGGRVQLSGMTSTDEDTTSSSALEVIYSSRPLPDTISSPSAPLEAVEANVSAGEPSAAAANDLPLTPE